MNLLGSNGSSLKLAYLKMAYSQTKEDKRIQELKTQLFGKQYTFRSKTPSNPQVKLPLQTKDLTQSNNISYIVQDLTKSFILAVVVVIAQLLLLLGKNNNLIKL